MSDIVMAPSLDSIKDDTKALLQDFCQSVLEKTQTGGKLWVTGCSTSEILGGHIGKAGSKELGEFIAKEIIYAAKAHGLIPAAQCCEHLNRALVVEREIAEKYNLTIVSAVPKPHAGGSFAAAFYKELGDPVLVEKIAADFGLDIGQTLIGMHLKRVAVPLRLTQATLGSAIVTAAYTRPPLIGGERAEYV